LLLLHPIWLLHFDIIKMTDRVARERFASLFANCGNGSTSFSKALKNFDDGHFDGKAISPELRAVAKNATGYTLVEDPNREMPPLRWPNSGPLTLPFDSENRRAFTEWFFASLNSGRRLPIPNFISKVPVRVETPPADPPTPPLYEHKATKPEPKRKRKPKCIITSDDEDPAPAATSTATSPPPKKKEKRRDSMWDYEDPEGNLRDFVVGDNVVEFED